MKCYNEYIVNVKKLKQNYLNIRKNLSNNTKLCAIVKANAYGIGSETVCKSLYGFVDFFGVATLQEALTIRSYDKDTNILVLGQVDSEEIGVCSDNNISVSISSYSQLQEISKIDKKIQIHIQVNTGLNRYGIRSIVEFKKALKIVDNNVNLNLQGVYSHFATKEKDRLFINIQFYKFLQFKNLVKDRNVLCHIANSYATNVSHKYQLDMVRNGFALYAGCDKTYQSSVLTIKSRIVHINYIKKGDTVGYDRTFTAKNKMKIAVIPLGYADGFDRRLSNNFSVIINNKKCHVVGLVCMDSFMVDVSDIDVEVGDEVLILGQSKDLAITLEDYAKALSTSPYEILLKFNYKRMNYIVKK